MLRFARLNATMTRSDRVEPIYCDGTIKTGREAGRPCRKFLGSLTLPYEKVLCPRCGKVHSNPAPTTANQ
jgi:hypothetical protein